MINPKDFRKVSLRMAPPRLGKASAVRRLLGGISPSLLAKMIEAGVVPRPIEVTPTVRLFDLDAVERAIRDRLAAAAA